MSNEELEFKEEIHKVHSRLDQMEKKLKVLLGDNEEDILDLQTIPVSEAKPQIEKFVHQHPGCWTSEIMEKLKLDIDVVVQALDELEKEGRIRSGREKDA